MRRVSIEPRGDWQQKCESLGFVFHSIGDGYWNESAYYEFSSTEIEDLETATNELNEMCIDAIDKIVQRDLLYRFQIPPDMQQLVCDSWNRKEGSLYGRFDLAFNGKEAPKLLEYNADTPTSLLEAADVQGEWRRELFPDKDQFNSIRKRVTEAWKTLLPESSPLHVSCIKHTSEDYGTVDFLRRTANHAGLKAGFVYIEDIAWDGGKKMFVDDKGNQIENLFKLYPWEWMVTDPYHQHLASNRTRMIEPMWKMLLSNKALLPILWEFYPKHPCLLPASFYPGILESGNVVRKPLLSREGANITISRGGTSFETGGRYGTEGYIYQEHFELPCFEGRYPVLGSWVIGGKAAGMGIREDSSWVTKNTSWFVPHIFS